MVEAEVGPPHDRRQGRTHLRDRRSPV